MSFDIDENWEKVPQWCRPYAWVEFNDEFKNRRGIYDPFQVDEQCPMMHENDGIWMVRSLHDVYGVFIRVNEIKHCDPPKGSLEWCEKEIKRLNKKMDRLKSDLEPVLLCAADIYNTGRTHHDLPLDVIPRLNSAAKVLGI